MIWKRDLYILGSRVDPVNPAQALESIQEMLQQPFWQKKRQHYIVTVNPEIVLQALADDKFRYIIDHASLSVPDGIGLKFAAMVLGEKIDQRVTGVDLMRDICRWSTSQGYSIFLLGGLIKGKQIVDHAVSNLKKSLPGIKIVGRHPGNQIALKHGKLEYDDRLNHELIQTINQSKAQILFVAFGAPKQEYWIYENLSKLQNIKIAVGVGGAFDYISEEVKRAPVWMRDLGLEWLYRLYYQPERYKRIFNATFKFVAKVLICKLRIIFKYRPNVVGVIINKKQEILLVSPTRRRWFAWQFPQGGIEKGEDPDKAIFREMGEELGTEKFKILRKVSNFHRYLWPKWARCAQCYKGQVQTLYILKFLGADDDFNLQNDIELKAFRWVERSRLTSTIDRLRRPLAQKVLKELDRLN